VAFAPNGAFSDHPAQQPSRKDKMRLPKSQHDLAQRLMEMAPTYTAYAMRQPLGREEEEEDQAL